MDPIISFKDFTFKYRAQIEPTLYDINLDIYPGEKILIVGPSGSGKSTLAHCINGLVPFAYKGEYTGSYIIGGKDPKDLGIFGLSKIVGTVLQDTDGQFIGLTVAEDIAFVLENDMVEQDEIYKRVKDVADTVEMSAFLEHAPRELSGGMKQRVSMAGVMIDEVPILMFDEPLANLDPNAGKNAVDLIDRINKDNNTTIIIIEHRLEDALYRDVDRIILIDEGRIVADAHPDEVLSSDVLVDAGIREPLYITALKHAGCTIEKESHPMHIETMDLTKYKDQVVKWYNRADKAEKISDGETILSIENVTFSYDQKRTVLDDISFSVKKGEMMAVVGKNGAGKSTLASLICGFINPNKGRIYLHGEDISTLSISERGEKIGFVMQNPNQMISKPMIFEEVGLGLKVRGVSDDEIKERVNETLKICGLYPFRNWPISALSYGQKKRVTIASILVMNPDIIILDEPTAGQDYRHYTEIMEFLKRINEEKGITIIMITHDMHLMLEYTDRCIAFASGKLLADTRPSKILTDDVIVNEAYLKRTSLYDLAKGCMIEDASSLVDYFIEDERKSFRN